MLLTVYIGLGRCFGDLDLEIYYPMEIIVPWKFWMNTYRGNILIELRDVQLEEKEKVVTNKLSKHMLRN